MRRPDHCFICCWQPHFFYLHKDVGVAPTLQGAAPLRVNHCTLECPQQAEWSQLIELFLRLKPEEEVAHLNPLGNISEQQWSAARTSSLDAFLSVGMNARVLGQKALERKGWSGKENPWQLSAIEDDAGHFSGCA